MVNVPREDEFDNMPIWTPQLMRQNAILTPQLMQNANEIIQEWDTQIWTPQLMQNANETLPREG